MKSDFDGDFVDMYCNNCWNTIGYPYRVKIAKLEKEIEKLNDEWHGKCKINNRK